ncbi:hypothetical protein SNE40_011000 [Patella caerulea]|uniref:Uncharacterized protein n=1 Tax=Patella caerulea TaxID=87958 RepID=A0AAN8JVN6_PATCE
MCRAYVRGPVDKDEISFSRNTEKRKEKSRDAARCRRSKETEVYCDLSQNLPLPTSITSQLDKASIMRLSISYLNVCNILDLKQQRKDEVDSEQEKKMDALCSKALEGFLFILSKEGDIVYVSDTVSKYLGIQQIELTGQSIYEFAHPCDHDEIKEIMSVKPNNSKDQFSDERIFFIRMKCTLTSKGRNVNLKSASYKVLKCTGRLVTQDSHKEMKNGRTDAAKIYPYLTAIGETIPHPANIEVPLDGSTFLTKHDMDMHFTYCDDRVQDLVGYESNELVGQSMYNYHHALDSHVVEKAFKDLFAKGQTMTGQYRFLAKKGGYAWVVTQGTIIYNNRTQKPQWVVCVHYVLSKVENKEAILSEVQLPTADDLLEPFRFELSTDKIFAPKTKDMEQPFFVPPELKKTLDMNEPEDLTHLAPTAGEGCIPLNFPSCSLGGSNSSLYEGESMPLMKDVPFCGTFKEEPDTVQRSICRQKQNYISSNNASPMSLSPRIGSPEDYKTTASPTSVDIMERFFSSMDTKQTFQTKSRPKKPESEMLQRAPFIPMNSEEDFSLVPPSTSDLFTLHNDFNPGLFGRTESVFMPKEAIFEVPPQPRVRQNFRDMMGESTSMASMEQPPSTRPMQVKRPHDMTSLEKGPPRVKRMRTDHPVELNAPPLLGQFDHMWVNGNSRDSVLLNLLLTGEDRSHGYKVKSPFMNFNDGRGRGGSIRSGGNNQLLTSSQCLSYLLPGLTQQDYEVNAPIQNSNLLQGADLLRALDVDVPGYKIRPSIPNKN